MHVAVVLCRVQSVFERGHKAHDCVSAEHTSKIERHAVIEEHIAVLVAFEFFQLSLPML